MKELTELIDELSQAAQAQPHLLRVMVELTYGCNLRCVHCYNPTHEAKNELTTTQVRQILDQLAAQGCLCVMFTGGELFTRRDAVEILHYAKSLGFLVNILTNATIITPELADQIQALDLNLVEISLYGATAPTYEAVTKITGSFARFVRGLDLLLERHVPIMLKLVMMTVNVDEFAGMKAFAQGRQLPYKIGMEIYPKVNGSKEPLAYRLSSDQAFELWRRASGERIRAHPQTEGQEEPCGSAGKLFDCTCGKSTAAVTPYGKLNLCVSTYYPQYDLGQGSVREGWQSLVSFVAGAKPGAHYECERCDLTSVCTRGSMDGWLYEQAFDAPCIPYFREVAEKKTEFLKDRESFIV